MTELELVKYYIGIPAADVTRDAEINEAITLARNLIDQYAGRPIFEGAVTDEIEYPNGAVTLSGWPIISINTITLDGVAQVVADYKVDSDVGILYALADNRRNTKPITGSFLSVNYISGFGDPPPQWLTDVSSLTAAQIISSKASAQSIASGAIKSQEIAGVYKVSYETSSSSSSSDGNNNYGQIPEAALDILNIHTARYGAS
jgi:hypothetical protein